MSTLPASPSESKSKTIADIARTAVNPPAKPNPNQKAPTRGSRLNNQMEAELEKFVGHQVTVKTHDETFTGTCVAFSVNMNIVVRTESEKIFIRHWSYLRRVRDGK